MGDDRPVGVADQTDARTLAIQVGNRVRLAADPARQRIVSAAVPQLHPGAPGVGG